MRWKSLYGERMAIKIPKKDAPKVFVLLSVVVIILLLVLLLPLDLKEKSRVEAPYSSEMSYNDKAYIDIVYCDPKYVIMEKGKPGKGVQDVVCEVQTTDNGSMLVAIPDYYYIQGTKNFKGSTEVDKIKYYPEGDYIPHSYPVLSFATPYRLHCRVSDTDKYDLINEEGNKVVLEMRYNNEGD